MRYWNLNTVTLVNVLRPRSTLAWIAKSQIGMGDVPYSELPSFGSPFDLRGYYWGKYRDKSMAYGIMEYRHMFGSPANTKAGTFGLNVVLLPGWEQERSAIVLLTGINGN